MQLNMTEWRLRDGERLRGEGEGGSGVVAGEGEEQGEMKGGRGEWEKGEGGGEKQKEEKGTFKRLMRDTYVEGIRRRIPTQLSCAECM